MADFCQQCAAEYLGVNDGANDLSGITSKEGFAKGLSVVVLCEGCGPCQVDPGGKCISPDCLKKHGTGSGHKNTSRRFKFGDKVRNTCAGENNPHRDGIFVRSVYHSGRLNHGTWHEVTDGKGQFWQSDPKYLELRPECQDESSTERREDISAFLTELVNDDYYQRYTFTLVEDDHHGLMNTINTILRKHWTGKTHGLMNAINTLEDET